MLRTITRKITAAALALMGIAAASVSCTPQLTDTGDFSLYYPGITDIGPSTNMDLTPSWHGAVPESFEIYNVTLDGESVTVECFAIDATTGVFQIRKSDNIAVGKYRVSIACTAGGKRFEFPDAITVNMMPAIPEGISVTPDRMTILLSQVTNTGSDEVLPTAQITTEGEHISIRNYLISGVRRDGNAIEDWSGIFSVDKSGKFSILKNSAFKAGIYVIDFKLTTMVVGTDSKEGIFTDALTVEIASPPVALAYNPSAARVETGKGYVSSEPEFTGSATGLEFSIKNTVPETDKISINASNGVITLAEGHDLAVGSEVIVSVNAKNDYGSRDFDQVLRLGVVEYIAPITLLEYNDTTVWEGTKVNLLPKAADGDEVVWSFEELPETLSELTIDETTGAISLAKKNTVAIGNYTIKVKAKNPKGSMTTEIKWNTIENPYAFTYVCWGNNLGLTPIENYASQHRVSTTETVEIPVVATDIKTEVMNTASFTISGGSNTKCAVIDENTGKITTDPSVFEGKVANMRAHFVFVTVKTGVGTDGETSKKIPVFFDFNIERNGYTVEYSPFAMLCNPKDGMVSAAPVIKKDGAVLSGDGLNEITMDYRRSFNYWNINGPAEHLNGAAAKGDNTKFLSRVWASYCKACGFVYDSEAGSRKAMSYYDNYENNTNKKGDLNKAAGYIRNTDFALRINPEKFVDEYGYANGIFVGQITFGTDGKDPQGAGDPFRLFPLFVWFDTQF